MNFKTIFSKLFANEKSQQIKSNDATKYLFSVSCIVGINTPAKYKEPYRIYSAFFNLFACVLLPLSFTIALLTIQMEIEHFVTSLQSIFNVYASALKFIIIAFLLPKLRRTETAMDKLDARCVEEQEKEEIRSAVIRGNRTVILFMSCYFSYLISAIVGSLIKGSSPYSLYIPFVDWRKSTTDLIIATIIECTLVAGAIFQQVVSDSYPLVYIGIIRTHIRILLTRISKLCADPKKTRQQNTEELIKCIIDHKNILELYYIIHPIISKTVFVQFVVTAVGISITLIKIMVISTLSSSIDSVFYICVLILEILPCCYYTNCLMDESDLFSNTIFHSNWVDQDVKYRKMLIFFMQKSQKTITLSAGKLFPINLNTFIGIAKFTMSLYTLFSQMNYGNK